MAIFRSFIFALFAAAVTLGLFTIMFTLITMDEVKLEDDKGIKIADIRMPERKIEAQVEADLERPEEPPEPPPEIPDTQVEIAAPDTGSLNIGVPKAKLDVGLGGGFARDSDFIPVYVPQPRYPSRAQTRGTNGYAVIQVIITETGGVRDPQMIEEHPTGYGFGRSAMKAAVKLKYNPRVVDGVPQEVPGVLYKFTFQIES